MRQFAEILAVLQKSINTADISMSKIVSVIKAVLPGDQVINDHKSLRALLTKSLPVVQRIHACANDHVLFLGPYKDLEECPFENCGLPRYYTTPLGQKKPVNVFRTIPLLDQLRLVYRDPIRSVAMRLYPACCTDANRDDVEISDITGSIGFKETVFDSGFMTDPRNPILIMGADGVNPWAINRVAKYGLWPYMFSLVNYERSIRNKHENLILGGLVSGHVYIDGKRTTRSAKSLNCYTQYFLDQINDLNGSEVVDVSYEPGSAHATFNMRAILLGTVTDFDGLGKLTNRVKAGSVQCCPKCNISGTWYKACKTRVFGQHRRYLSPSDPIRNDPTYGQPEHRPPPRVRTMEQALRHGTLAARLKHSKPKQRHTEHVTKTGLYDLSPLATHPGYNIVDRSFLDLMHIIKNVVDLHLMKRMGNRAALPSLPTSKRKHKTAAQLSKMSASAVVKWKASCAARDLEVEELNVVRQQIIEDDAKWIISDADKISSHERMRNLVCPMEYYNRKPIWEFAGTWDTNDWQHFFERYGIFALYGCLDDSRFNVVVELFEILSVLSKYSQTRNELKALKQQTIRLLVEFERTGPVQEQTVVFHLLIHLVEQAIRWGPPVCSWLVSRVF